VAVATVELDPALGRDPEALIKEARRRQRRRYLAVGLAGLVVAATVAGSLLGGAGHSRQHKAPRPRISAVRPARPVSAPPSAPLILAGTHTAVLLWPVGYPAFSPGGGPPAYLDNLTTGKLAVTGRPAIGAGDFQPLLITVGRYLVYVGDGTMVIRGDLRGRPRVLAKTPFFAPSAVPGHVWLGGLQRPNAARHVARLASVTGGPLGPPVTLPPDTQMIRGTDGGLLLENFSGHGAGLKLWSPGSVSRALPFRPNPFDGFGASARLVEYATGCRSRAGSAASGSYDACRWLRIYDVVTGQVLSLLTPPATVGWVPPEFNLEQPISPPNAMVAAEAALPSAHGDRGRLYTVQLNSQHPRPRAVPRSASFVRMRVAWSVRGGWVFFQGPRGHMWAYQPRTGNLRASRTPCCQVTVMAAVQTGPS
jgi:hypothetical protein